MPSETFDYTGSEQTWQVPSGVSTVTVEIDGAGGGSAITSGGAGGRVVGELSVTGGETLYIYVGGAGERNAGGWNGGGNGGYHQFVGDYNTNTANAGGGGGASDVRQGGNADSNRVAVAAGGGGGVDSSGAGNTYFSAGGAGGPNTGETATDVGGDGSSADGGHGGDQSSGGSGGGASGSGTSTADGGGNGSLATGGVGGAPNENDDTNAVVAGGGGGAGYYGAGGGGAATSYADSKVANYDSHAAAGGGGGSNYTGGLSSTSTNSQGGGAAADNNGQIVISYTDPPPQAPSNLTATTASSTSIDLSWTDNSSNEDEFRIERRQPGQSSFSQIDTVGVNVTTYTDSGLQQGHTYEYQVRACNASGCSSYTTPDSATTTIPAPSGLSATTVSDTQVDLSWTDNATDETGYDVDYKQSSSGTWSNFSNLGANATAESVTGLQFNTTYDFRVRAFGEDTNSSFDTASATTDPPFNITIDGTEVKEITIDGTVVTEVTIDGNKSQ